MREMSNNFVPRRNFQLAPWLRRKISIPEKKENLGRNIRIINEED
jgi:hypothetical protein